MPTETFFNLPEEKRTALLDVILDEFAGNDYRSASVSRIVERAGIAKGSFYQYFADKKDCYLYLLQLGIQEKTVFLRQSMPPEGTDDLFDMLKWQIDAGMRFQFSNPRLAQIALRATMDEVPLPEETMQIIRRGAQVYFREQVQKGMSEGSLRPDLDADLAAFVLNMVFVHLGKYLLDRFEISGDQLLAQGGQAMNQTGLRSALEQTITILSKGMSATAG